MIPIPAQTQTHLSKPPSPPPSCQPARRLPSCRPEEGSVRAVLCFFLENGDSVYLWQLDITPRCVVEATGLRVKYQLKELHRSRLHPPHLECFHLTLCYQHSNMITLLDMMHAHRAALAYHLQDCSGGLGHLDLHGQAREGVSLRADQGKFQQPSAQKYPKNISKSF